MTHSLAHHFLLATSSLGDSRFDKALIYLCRHNTDGAWGFVVNQPLPVSVGGLLGEMDIDAGAAAMRIPALNGGPLRTEAGFIIHTGLPEYSSSFAVSENICLTTSKDVLPAIAKGALSHYLMCMGFCSWQKGQLPAEIARGDWLVCPADIGILFGEHRDKLAKAYDKLGIHPDLLAPIVGKA
ncbi:MAG: YqgE/AlgH family protein [Moraxella sp.]|nr:YqgE/AlgH family protein [Moraxella sp.]